MSIDDTDVLARLRAGADQAEERDFDAYQVLAGSRRALRRRRSWQAAGACTTAAAVTFALALAGPVPVPGLGDVTLPGSEQVRELFGLAEAPECAVPEPTARRSPVESGTSLRPGVTFDLARARPMSACFDVSLDGAVTRAGTSPSTLTEDGTFWRHPTASDALDTTNDSTRVLRQVDPFNNGAGDAIAAPIVTSSNDEKVLISGLTTQGDQAAWFELTTQDPDQPPSRVVLSAGGERTDLVTGEHTKSRSITEIEGDYIGNLAVTAQRVAWRQEEIPAGSTGGGSTADPWGMATWVASIESGEPELLAERATAIGGDDDEIVVATLDQPATGSWTTTFTSFGDDGTETTVLTLEHPSETYVPLVDLTDGVLTYVLDGGYHLAVVPRVNGIADPDADRAVAVRLGSEGVDSLSAAGDAVAWVSGRVAYLLREAGSNDAAGPDLVRIAQGGLGEGVAIALAGDRIAWSTPDVDYETGGADGAETELTVGTLREPEELNTAGPGSAGRAVPAAPTVTVPEDAVFRAHD